MVFCLGECSLRTPADHLTSPFPTIPQSTASATGARATPRRSRPPGTASPVYSRVKVRMLTQTASAVRETPPFRDPPSQSPRRVDSLFPHTSLLPSQSNASVTGARVSTRTATRPPPTSPPPPSPERTTTASATGAKTTPSTTHPASIAPRSNLKRTTASATGARIQTMQTLRALPASRSHPA